MTFMIRKWFGLFFCCMAFLCIPVCTAKAEQLSVNITREDGLSVLIKENELFYTNAPLYFQIAAEAEQEAICEYALSSDGGENYSEWTVMEANSYQLNPDFQNEKKGIWNIKFRKTVTEEKSVSDNEIEQTENESAEDKVEDVEIVTTVIESRVFQIGFDLEIPKLTLSSEPALEKWSNGDLNCTLESQDMESGIHRVTVETGGEVITEETYEQADKKQETTVSFVLSKEAETMEGQEFSIIVTDYAGNQNTHKGVYYIDKERPTFELSGVLNGSIQNHDVDIQAAAQDNLPQGVTICCQINRDENGTDPMLEEQIQTTGTAQERCLLTKKYERDGNYHVSAYAKDQAGNCSEIIELVFRIDKTMPNIHIGGVLNDTDYTTGQTVSVHVEEQFFQDCQIELDVRRSKPGLEEKVPMESWHLDGKVSEHAYTFETDGDYVMLIKAVDAAGNSETKEARFRIDKTAPQLEIRGLETQTVTNRVPHLMFHVEELFYDTANISCVLVKKNPDGTFFPAKEPVWKLEQEQMDFPMEIKEEGVYLLRAEAADRAGNHVEQQVQFTLDYTPPVIGYLDSLHQKYLKGFKLPIDFASKIMDMTGINYQAYLNTRNFSPGEEVGQDGKYILRVEAVDEAGNEAEKTIEFIVDKTLPKLVVNGARRDGTVARNAEVILSLYDEEDLFESVRVNGKAQAISKDRRTVILPKMNYGEYEIEVKAVDAAENELTQVIHMKCALAANPFREYEVIEKTIVQENPVLSNERVFHLERGMRMTVIFVVTAFAAAAAAIAVVMIRKAQPK